MHRPRVPMTASALSAPIVIAFASTAVAETTLAAAEEAGPLQRMGTAVIRLDAGTSAEYLRTAHDAMISRSDAIAKDSQPASKAKFF